MEESGTITAVASAVASSGFAIWYGWYVTTTVIPKLLTEFRMEQAESRKVFSAALAIFQDDRERFDRAMKSLSNGKFNTISDVPE